MPIDSRLIAVERERRRRQQVQVQPTPLPIMAAHQQRANVNPFQDNFNQNPNTVSMQQVGEMVAPQIDQPLLERIGRGVATVPIGMAGMVEQATSDPLAFLKGTGQYLNTWAQRLSPNALAPETIQARAEWGQQAVTDPVGSGLDALGVVGTAVGLPALGGKIRGAVKSPIPEVIRDVVKPEPVPEIIAGAVKPKEAPIKAPTYLDSQVTPMSDMQVKIAQERLRRKVQGTPANEQAGATGSVENQLNVRDVNSTPSTPPVEKPVVAETQRKPFVLSNVTLKESGETVGIVAVDGNKFEIVMPDGTRKWINKTDVAKQTNVVSSRKSFSDIQKELGDDKLYDAMQEWDDAAIVSEDGKKVLTPHDSRNPDPSNMQDVTKEFVEWHNSRAGKISTDPTPSAAVRPAQSIEPTEYEAFLEKSNKAREDVAKQVAIEKEIEARNKAEKQALENERIARLNKTKQTFVKTTKTISADGYNKEFRTEMSNNIDNAISEWKRGMDGHSKSDIGTNVKEHQGVSTVNASEWGAPEKLEFNIGNGTYRINNTFESLSEFKKKLGGIRTTPETSNVPLWVKSAKNESPYYRTDVYAGESPFKFKKDISEKVISKELYDDAVADVKEAQVFYESLLSLKSKVLDKSITLKSAMEQVGVKNKEKFFEKVENASSRLSDAKKRVSRYDLTRSQVQAGEPPPKESIRFGRGGAMELGFLATPSAIKGVPKIIGEALKAPFRIPQYAITKIENFMERKGLSNPIGTPEVVLKNTGIVDAFREAGASQHQWTYQQSQKLGKILGDTINNQGRLGEMFKHLDDPKAKLTVQEQSLRQWFDDVITEINQHRKERGQELIEYREGYVPHIFEQVQKALADDPDMAAGLPRKVRNRFENPRTGAEGYRRDLLDALKLYTEASARDIHVNDALYKVIPKIEKLPGGKNKILRKEIVDGRDGITRTFNFYNLNSADMWTKRGYAESFVRAQLGLPTAGQRFLKQFGMSPKVSQRTSNMATGMIYRNLLGMAIDTGIKNLSQPVHAIAEYGYTPSLRGIAKFLTPKGIKAARSEHLLKEFDAFLLTKDMPLTQKLKLWRKFDENVINGPMRFTEFVNRGISYHTGLDDALRAGKSFAEAEKSALAGVRKTQFEYNKLGTSPNLRGPFTRPAAQFLTFPTKTSEMIYRWGLEGDSGRGKLLRYFATVGALVYGGKELGVELGNIFFDPTKTVDADSKEGMELPISGRKVQLAPGRLGTTGFSPQGALPVVTKPYKYIKGQIEKPQTLTERVGTTAREFLPGGRFIGKAYDVVSGRDIRDDRGRLTKKDSSGDAFIRLFGGRSSNQEIESNKREAVSNIEKDFNSRRQKIVDAVISGDKNRAMEMRDELVKDYPYLAKTLRETLKGMIQSEAKKKNRTSNERFYDSKTRKRIEGNL